MKLFTSILLLVAIMPARAVQAADAPNLVRNGDFSSTADGKPQDWKSDGEAKLVSQTLRAARDAEGRTYAELVCTRCEGGSPSAHAMLAQVGAVQLAKSHTYELTCRMRCDGIEGRTISVAISDTKTWSNCGLNANFALSDQWKSYRRIFRATQDVGPTSRLQFWYTEPGTLCIADVRIAEVAVGDVQFADVVPASGGKNLVPNGSFEAGACGWTSMGMGSGWGDLAGLHGEVRDGGGKDGGHFLRISMGEGRTPVLGFDYYQPVVRRELRPLAAGKGWIALERGASYTVSCQMRASVDGVRATIGARCADPSGGRHDHAQQVQLTTEWKPYSMSFRADGGHGFVFAGPDLEREVKVDVDVDAVQLEKGERATEYAPGGEIEFGMEPGEFGGIFTAEQQANLFLCAGNNGDNGIKVRVTVSVSDFWDHAVQLPEMTIDIAARSSVRQELKLPKEWRGYYRIVAEAKTGQRTLNAAARIAIVPTPSARDSVCGINHAFADPPMIRLAAKAGVTWYRDWSLKWQHVEPFKGEFHWDVADAQIERVLNEKRLVLPLLPPFPSADWASEAPDDLPKTGYPGIRLRSAWGPKDPAELAAYIEKAVARYKDRIHIWEFLNEPIYTDYALPADSANRYHGRKYKPEDYVTLLQIASAAMRKADPACKVIGGIGSGPRGLTKQVIDAGILKSIDIFNLHIYPGSRLPEAYVAEMDGLLAMMEAAGGRKPIWITEFSYYGADDLPRRPFIPREGDWAENRLLDDERQCADYTTRFFAVMLSRGVGKIFIHAGTTGRANEPNFECALFAPDGTPRKLLPALAVFTDLLGALPKSAGYRRLPGGAHAAAFETGTRSVLMLWTSGDGAGVKLPPAGDAMWMDAMGGRLAAPPAKLSSSPVYGIGKAGQAKAMLEALGG